MIVAEHPEVCIAITNVGNGPLMTYVHSSRTPPGEILEGACDEVEARQFDLKRLRLLVFTDGGSPSPVARRRLISRLARFSERPRTAVVSDQPSVRFLVTILSLFNPNSKAFASREVNAALAFLEVQREDLPQVAELLTTLHQKTYGRFNALHAVVHSLLV